MMSFFTSVLLLLAEFFATVVAIDNGNGWLMPILVFSLLQIAFFIYSFYLIKHNQGLIVVSESCLTVSCVFIVWEYLISTIGLNVLLLAFVSLYSLEGLIAALLTWLQRRMFSAVALLLANFLVLLYSVMQFVYGDVPFGYGP